MTCLLQTLGNDTPDKHRPNWNSTGSSPDFTPPDFPSRVVSREGCQESSIPNFICFDLILTASVSQVSISCF